MSRARRGTAWRSMRPGLAALVLIWRRLRHPAPRTDRASEAEALGRRGEQAAAKALRRAGCRILSRRLRTPAGEIDILALDGDTLVLVEVKASRARDAVAARAVRPSDRVDRRKRLRLVGAARTLRRRDLSRRPYRIDIASVVFEGRRASVSIIRGAVRPSHAP